MKTGYAIILFLLMGIPTLAQIEEVIKQDFNTSEAPELMIRNSFGDVKIEVHESSRIEVLVEITVIPKKERDMKRIKDKVRIEIKETGNRVELVTINDLDGINTEELEIDYEVKMPLNTSLEVYNQFGDAYVERIAGNLYARIQHGDLFSGEASGAGNSIKVQFGELRLERILKAEIEVQHGDFQADYVNNSEIELQFSDGEVGKISGDIEMEIQHSDLKVEAMDQGLERLELDAQFSDITLEGDHWSDYHFELEGGFTDYSITSEMKDLIYYESYGINTIEMRINQEANKKMVIDANHSDVDFD